MSLADSTQCSSHLEEETKTVEPPAAAVQRLTGLHGPCSNGCSEVRMRQATGNKLQVFLCVED